MVPAGADHVALADQDDRWHPNKLETLARRAGRCPDGLQRHAAHRRRRNALISDTYWTRRVPNHDNFASLLLGNSVTGAAALFRRDLLDAALPFPPRVGNLYHDHWLALVAASTGRIAYVDRPLYDYVQHPEAVIGHAGANVGVVGRRRPAAARGPARPRPRAAAGRVAADLLRRVLPDGADRGRARAPARPGARNRPPPGAEPRPGARSLRDRRRLARRRVSCGAWLATTPAAARRVCSAGSPGAAPSRCAGVATPSTTPICPPGIVGVDPSPATRVLR